MEELTKRNGKGVWMREIEKALRRFNASLEWLSERISLRDVEIDRIRADTKMEDFEKNQMICSKRMKSIAEVLEEVEVLFDTHFNAFSETKSSAFLKLVLANQAEIEIWVFKNTWRTLNCTMKIKVIQEVQNMLCIWKRKYRESHIIKSLSKHKSLSQNIKSPFQKIKCCYNSLNTPKGSGKDNEHDKRELIDR